MAFTNLDISNISVKSFISDLPRVFNNNFNSIKNFLTSLFNVSEQRLTIDNITANGAIDTNSITAQNIILKSGTTKTSLADILSRLETLETTLTELQNNS